MRSVVSWSDLGYQGERRAVMVGVSGEGSVITDRSSDKPPPAPSTARGQQPPAEWERTGSSVSCFSEQ